MNYECCTANESIVILDEEEEKERDGRKEGRDAAGDQRGVRGKKVQVDKRKCHKRDSLATYEINASCDLRGGSK